LDAIADRRLLHAVLLVLTEYGVLVERDGSLDGWAENGTTQSLLDVSAERWPCCWPYPWLRDGRCRRCSMPHR